MYGLGKQQLEMRRKTLTILASGSGFNSSSRALSVVIPHLAKANTVPEQIRARFTVARPSSARYRP